MKSVPVSELSGMGALFRLRIGGFSLHFLMEESIIMLV